MHADPVGTLPPADTSPGDPLSRSARLFLSQPLDSSSATRPLCASARVRVFVSVSLFACTCQRWPETAYRLDETEPLYISRRYSLYSRSLVSLECRKSPAYSYRPSDSRAGRMITEVEEEEHFFNNKKRI